MIKIAICDDEKIFRDNIENIISGYMKQKEILYEIDTFGSGKELVDLGIEMLQYTIIFLDINMDEMDGLETAQKIRAVSQEIYLVFVTAYVTYAFDGYKVEAVRYILKNKINFIESVWECLDAIRIKMNYVIERKSFDFTEGTKKISLEHLLYIESRLHRLDFHVMAEGRLVKYALYRTLNEIEKELADSNFLRIHQSYLINMKHLNKIVRYTAFLSNGAPLNIARVRYRLVEEAYITFKGEI